MKFLVRRTSCYCRGEHKPCDEAERTSYVYYDRRTVNKPEKLTYNNALQDWYSRGENHRTVKGMIVRDFPHNDGWAVVINTLEELMSFVDNYGDIVLTNNDDYDLPEIEIYDDYRE